MDIRITATDLARKLGDVLGRVRYRYDVFIVERNGEAIARLVPLPTRTAVLLGDALRACRGAAPPDRAFAEDLGRVNAADRPPRNPCDS